MGWLKCGIGLNYETGRGGVEWSDGEGTNWNTAFLEGEGGGCVMSQVFLQTIES